MINFTHLRALARRSTELTKGRVPASSIDGWITTPTASHSPNAEHRARIPIQHVEVSPGKIVARIHPDFEPEGLDAKGREEFRKFAEKPIVLEGEKLEKHRAIAKEIAENTKDDGKKGDAERQAKALESKATPEHKPAPEPDYSEQWKKAAASVRRYYGGMVPSPTQWAGTLHHAGLPEHLGPEHSPEFEEIPGAPGSYQVKGSPYYTKPWEMGETEHAEARRRDPIREKHSELEQAVYAHSTDTPHHLSTAMSFLWDAAYQTGDRPTREAVDAVTTGARLIDEAKTDKQRKVLEKEQEERIAKLLPKAERYLKSDSWEGRKLAEHLRKYNETRTATEEATKALEAFRAAHPSLARPGNYQQMLEDTLKRKIAIGPEHAKRIARDYPEIAAKHKAHPDIVAHFEEEKRKEDAAKRLLEASKPKHIADSTPEQYLASRKPFFSRNADGTVQVGGHYGERNTSPDITLDEKHAAVQKLIDAAKAKDAEKPVTIPDWLEDEHPEHAKALSKLLRIEGDQADTNLGVEAGVHALTKIPHKLLQDLRDQGLNGIHVGTALTPDMDHLLHLRDIVRIPEPWDSRAKWDDVCGVFSHSANVAATTTAKHYTEGQVAHTVLHELGHAIGFNQGLNDAQWLKDAHTRFTAMSGKLRPYFHRSGAGDDAGQRELLAEGFADLVVHGVEEASNKYDRAFVRNLVEHLGRYDTEGKWKLPPKDRGDMPFKEFVETYADEIHPKIVAMEVKRHRKQIEDQLAAHQEQLTEMRKHGYSSSDETYAMVEGLLPSLKRQLRDSKSFVQRETTLDSEATQRELRDIHSHWGKLCDLEISVKKVPEQDRTTVARWLSFRLHSFDGELAKRSKKLLKKHPELLAAAPLWAKRELDGKQEDFRTRDE